MTATMDPIADLFQLPTATSDAQTISEKVAADGTQFILAVFTNLAGKACAKLVPASAVVLAATMGLHLLVSRAAPRVPVG